MKLSDEAFQELKEILRDEIGEDGLDRFTDEMIHEFGFTLLRIGAACMKARIAHGCEAEDSVID